MARVFSLSAAAILIASAPSAFAADPVFNPANGSYYLTVETKLTWTQAQAAAAAQNYLGIPGRLATITSAAENAFVVSNSIPAGSVGDSFWLGGFQPAGSPEPDGGWQWITGEPWSYTNWRAGDPNNGNIGGGFENRLEMFNSAQNGTWVDLYDGNSGLSEGYVIEFAPVPEPGSVGLLAAGAGALWFRRRRGTSGRSTPPNLRRQP